MDILEIILVLSFGLSIGLILYLILRDPIYIFKSFLRGLKADHNLGFKIVLFPIWGPIWLINKTFGLGLYYKEFEEVSDTQVISFSEYDKYLLINTNDSSSVTTILNSFESKFDLKDFPLNFKCSKTSISKYDGKIILKIDKETDFNTVNELILYIDNSAPKDKNYYVKGIFLNSKNQAKSYFLFHDTGFQLKLIGKTYENKKMYVNLDPEIESNETIYLNSNMDYFKNFDFDEFEIKHTKHNYTSI